MKIPASDSASFKRMPGEEHRLAPRTARRQASPERARDRRRASFRGWGRVRRRFGWNFALALVRCRPEAAVSLPLDGFYALDGFYDAVPEDRRESAAAHLRSSGLRKEAG